MPPAPSSSMTTRPPSCSPRSPSGRSGKAETTPPCGTRPGWAAAEAALKQTGLIHSDSGPDEVHVSDDVMFSLRYWDDGHIARELGEPPLPAEAVISPAPDGPAGPAGRAGPEARE